MTDETKPDSRRRWVFSLRTLLVLVAVSALTIWWLNKNLNWIKRRQIALQAVGNRDVFYSGVHSKPKVRPALPWSLAFLGETHVSVLYVERPKEMDLPAYAKWLRELEVLFPEAEVVNLSETASDDPLAETPSNGSEAEMAASTR